MCSLISRSHCHLGQLSMLPIQTRKSEYGIVKVKMSGRLKVVCKGMLTPRKFMQRKKKMVVFKDAADEAEQKNWWRLMNLITETGFAVSVLSSEKKKNQTIPKDLLVGTLIRFKQLKKWNHVAEILEWLRSQKWWDFGKTDFFMLITAYGKLGDFNGAEKVLEPENSNVRRRYLEVISVVSKKHDGYQSLSISCPQLQYGIFTNFFAQCFKRITTHTHKKQHLDNLNYQSI